MRQVTFYRLTDGRYEEAGDVRLADGALEITDDLLRKTLEAIPVVMEGRRYWPSGADPEAYLAMLPMAFCGSYFRASLVEEVS